MPQAAPSQPEPMSSPPHAVRAEGTNGRGKHGRATLRSVVVGKRLRRRTRWLVRALVLLPLLLVLGALLAIRSPAVEWIVAAQLRGALGCEVRARSAVLTFDGRVVVRGLSLRVPGMTGPAAEFLYAPMAEIDLDWSRGLASRPEPIGVRLHQPHFRVSTDSEDTTVNLQSLHPARPDAMGGDRPLRILVIAGQLELGEHKQLGAGGYQLLRVVGVTGELTPAEHDPGLYEVRFGEDRRARGAAPGVGPGISLRGNIDLKASVASLEIKNVDLDAWPATSVPSFMRDVWEQLGIKGRILTCSLEYFPSEGLAASLQLDDVSMDAIVPAHFPTNEEGEDVLSLRKVHGTIRLTGAGLRADIAGRVEDQDWDSRVLLTLQGLESDAALQCRIVSRNFKVDKDPSLLPFAPPVVRQRLLNFSGPTGIVDSDIIIRRDAPGADGPAPFKVTGWLSFHDGTAAFDRVPYPFHSLEGRVRFDDEGIDILQIRGLGPDGEVMTATGRIAPPNDDAAVHVEVAVKGVPLNDAFMKSLPPSRAEAIDFLFNRTRYEELVREGLVVSPPGPGDAAPAPGSAPVFAPGGRMDLSIVVNSSEGQDAPWHYTVDVAIPDAGILTRAFPFPVAARDIHLVLTESDARLIAGTFRGLAGGSVGVEASVVLEVDGAPVIRPAVTIDATGVPLDPLLLHAIGKAGGAAPGGDAGLSGAAPEELLRRLDLSGAVDCRAEVTAPDADELAFDVRVSFTGLEARPASPGTPARLALSEIDGEVRLTNSLLEVPRLSGNIRPLAAPTPGGRAEPGGQDLGTIGLVLRADMHTTLSTGPGAAGAPADQRPRSVSADVSLVNLDLEAPIEETIRAFVPGLSARLLDARTLRRPTGRVNGAVEVRTDDGGELSARATVTHLHDVAFSAEGERMTALIDRGAIVIDTAGPGVVRFDGTAMRIGRAGTPPTSVTVDGALLLGPAPADGARGTLTVSAADLQVGSSLAHLALRRALSPDDYAQLLELRPSGSASATLVAPDDILWRADDGPLGVDVVVTPHSFGFDFEGRRIEVPRMSGRVTFGDSGTRFEELVLGSEMWSGTINGGVERLEDGGRSLRAGVSIDAASLTPGIRALLPGGLRDSLDQIKLAVFGPLICENGHVEYDTGPDGKVRHAGITGTIQFTDAELDVGAPLRHADGVLDLDARRIGEAGGGSRWSFDLGMAAHRLEAGGLAMTDLRATLAAGHEPGVFELGSLAADCYAGRVTARARVWSAPEQRAEPASGAQGAGDRYDAEITFAGVCFAPVLAALDAARGEDASPGRGAVALSADPSRGRLDGTLAISGAQGDEMSRSGVGSVRIWGGDVVEMPLVLTLVQLSNFQLPSEDKLDFLQALFHLSRDRVVFDQIDLLSTSVAITGRGTMTWPAQELDLRFNSRSGARVPVLSDLLETLRNEIATTRIRGTLSDPRVGPEPLMGTRELIGSIVGEAPGMGRTPGLPDARAERERVRLQRAHAPSEPVSATPSGGE